MFDTHCHLQFSAFEGKVDEIVVEAYHAGVIHMVVPGTDVETSEKGITIAQKYEHVYAAVGIHPHHVYQIKKLKLHVKKELEKIEALLENRAVVAVGEIGLDRHAYKKTKYENYQVDDSFIDLQKELFIAQVQLAKKYKKSVIIHNRETRGELLELLFDHWTSDFEGRMVFHCCEPDGLLLDFAKKHRIFIGVDGDITYRKDKQEFIKQVPLELLVLETDAPFLLPEPFRSQKLFPNEPKYLLRIKKHIAERIGVSEKMIQEKTVENAKRLFSL